MDKIFDNIATEVVEFFNCFFANAVEWLLTIGVGAFAGLVAFAIEPQQENAVYNNPAENYPYSGETIPIPALFLIAIVVPCLIIGLIAILHPRKIELCFAYLSLFQALCFTLLVTETLKVYVARPRPNYFNYCGFNKESKTCTGPDKFRKDAKVSFPSGHASISFCCATWFSLFLQNYLALGPELWFVVIRFLPFVVSIFISATRITDYMHHVSDVVAGAALGTGIAYTIFSAQIGRIKIQQKRPYDPLAQL